jgi:hypothetical protein
MRAECLQHTFCTCDVAGGDHTRVSCGICMACRYVVTTKQHSTHPRMNKCTWHETLPSWRLDILSIKFPIHCISFELTPWRQSFLRSIESWNVNKEAAITHLKLLTLNYRVSGPGETMTTDLLPRLEQKALSCYRLLGFSRSIKVEIC